MFSTLIGMGLPIIANLVKDKGAKFIKDKLGIDLNNIETLSEDDKAKLQSLEQALLLDRQNARSTSIERLKSSDWLVRNAGSIINLITVVSFVVLVFISVIGYILNEFSIEKLSHIMMPLSGLAGAIIQFYNGSNKEIADQKRHALNKDNDKFKDIDYNKLFNEGLKG